MPLVSKFGHLCQFKKILLGIGKVTRNIHSLEKDNWEINHSWVLGCVCVGLYRKWHLWPMTILSLTTPWRVRSDDNN